MSEHWIGWMVGATTALLAGCATADESPMGTDSDIGTDSSFSTSSSTSSSTASTSDDSDSSDVTSTTNDSSDSTTSTTTGGQTGSTGCPEGEEGCPCRAEDPVCEGGLQCVGDVCTAGLCEMQDHEPNDNPPDEAFDLGMFDDDAPAMNVMSQLNGPDDVDWFTYSCVDTTNFENPDPTVVIDQNTLMRVCIFLDCENGGNPTNFCEGGAEQVDASFEFLEGCCVTDGSTIDVSSYNCPDSQDDAITAYIRVDMGDTMQCEPYSLTYNC